MINDNNKYGTIWISANNYRELLNYPRSNNSHSWFYVYQIIIHILNSNNS